MASEKAAVHESEEFQLLFNIFQSKEEMPHHHHGSTVGHHVSVPSLNLPRSSSQSPRDSYQELLIAPKMQENHSYFQLSFCVHSFRSEVGAEGNPRALTSKETSLIPDFYTSFF